MSFLLHHLLIKSANQFPDNDAVVFNNEKLTYREFDEITTKLAHELISKGVQQGHRVGIFINKSIPSIISIHGILKAGAVYVPLDPNAPLSRTAYIIDNCDIKCLLTSTAKAEFLPEILEQSKSLEVIILTDNKNEYNEDDLSAKIVLWKDVTNRLETDIPENKTIETDLAYILYTSGSTGSPKGVMISHINALTFVNWVYNTFEFSSKDRFSNHAPLHFDLSILDIYVAFKAGATLFPVPEKSSLFPMKLADWIQDNKISVWYSVPSILSMMVLHGKLNRYSFENLRIIFFAGEVFPVKYLRDLMDKIPHPDYYNLYGPTETNVITYYQAQSIPPDQTKPIPIGKACANMDVFALKKDGSAVTKPGEEGELVGRGSCVAQGYWGDKEKSQKVFISNPRQPFFQETVYRTGDLVTIDTEGNYIYVSRIDHMIKSRGYRIEIGEIEAVIYTNENVKEAAVIAIPDELISNRIMAIVVSQNNNSLSASDIRMFCAEKLPKYMIPEIIEFKETLPKTSTGKVDKPTLLKQYTQP